MNSLQKAYKGIPDVIHPVLLAIQGLPNLLVNGKTVAPSVLFSEAFAAPVLLWYASSLSIALHEKNIFDLGIVADPDHLCGMRISKFDPMVHMPGSSSFDENSLPMSSVLLILLNASETFVRPAIQNKPVDYLEVMLRVKETVSQHYDPKSNIILDDQWIELAVTRSLNGLSKSTSVKNQQSRI